MSTRKRKSAEPSKATPRPWFLLSSPFGGECISNISNTVLHDWASEKHYVATLTRANARLIVRCVNNAEALVEALRLIDRVATAHEKNGIGTAQKVARAALAAWDASE